MTFLFFTITRTSYYIKYIYMCVCCVCVYIYIIHADFFFFNLNLLSVLLNVSRVCAVSGGIAQTCPVLENPFLLQGSGMLIWD